MKWETLSHLPIDQQRALQDTLVRNFFKRKLPFSPFYRSFFEQHKLSFDDIQSVDDLQRIPFTSKQDVAPTNENPGKSRQFILQPDEALIKKHSDTMTLMKIVGKKLTGQDVTRELEREYKPIHLHFTTGRTAQPTAFGYSERDLNTFRETGGRMFEVIGVPRDVFAVNAFPYAPHLAFWLSAFAMQTVGLTSIQTGGGKIMGTRKICDILEKTKAGLATFIPGYCYHLMREAQKEGRDFSALKYIIFGGERVSPGLREKVKETLLELHCEHPTIFATYAFTEGKTAWIQCAENTGYHLYPDLEYFEVIDKEGNRVKNGEPGELVYTALDWRGTVVVRYRTGDMTLGIEYSPCPHCGKTVPRIHPDVRRSSEIKEFHLTKVKGELIDLNAFYPILSGNPGVEEWQVEITKINNDPYGLDQLVIHVAPKPGVDFIKLSVDVDRAIKHEAGVAPIIKEKPLEELLASLGMETELKEKRLIDNRPML